MTRWTLLVALLLLFPLLGCQPVGTDASTKSTDKKTDKATSSSKTTEGGIKPPNPDPGN
jgi:hypothetical protein